MTDQQSSPQELKDQLISLRDRIVGHEKVDVRKLLDHPLNPRRHSKKQGETLEEILKSRGVMDEIKVNKNTMHIINGHLRKREYIALARKHKNPALYIQWVTWLDIKEEEEPAAIALYDRLAREATYDTEATLKLLEQIEETGGLVDELLGALEHEVTLADSLEEDSESEDGDFTDFSGGDDAFEDLGATGSAKSSRDVFKVGMNAADWDEFVAFLQRLGKASGLQDRQTVLILPPK